ncbi:MAG: sugar porter family MFS transporter [Planctomycetaceae bacterium]|nr:sugar porter family MFS transporter [Planctomycetaceae bacterium]
MFVFRVCGVAALGGLLFGYDTAVIAGAIGPLQEHFHLSAAMKGWAAACALFGCVLGVSLAGVLGDRAGRKQTQLLSAILFFLSAIGTALAVQFAAFIVFRILGGVGVGIASMTAPMYIAEISPARLRGRLVSVNQLAVVSGILVIYFVNYLIALGGDAAWNATVGWRWMFASGAVPSGLFFLLLLHVPESPRWLVERNRIATAHDVLVRLGGESFAAQELHAICESVATERQRSVRRFGPELRPVLWLGLTLAVLQQATGINVFLYYAPEIFKQLGAVNDLALLQTIVVGGVNLMATLLAIGTVDRWGRRPLMIGGASGMGGCLLTMGLVLQFQGMAGWVLLLLLGYVACFALSVGPVTWVILSEIFPNNVRSVAMSLATFALWTANFLVSQTFPMMDESPWLTERFHHGFPFYVYGSLCIVLVVVTWLGVPETKGRSLEEIERFWTKRTHP